MAVLSEAEKEARREAQRRAREAERERQEAKARAGEAVYQNKMRRYADWEDCADRLRSLVPKALDALEKGLEDGADPKQRMTVALAVLRAAGMGALDPPNKPSEYVTVSDRELTALLEGVSLSDLRGLGD